MPHLWEALRRLYAAWSVLRHGAPHHGLRLYIAVLEQRCKDLEQALATARKEDGDA